MSARSVKSVCPYCGVGCGLILRTHENRITHVLGDPDHPANFGRLCTKGLTCAQPLTAPDRLTQAQFRATRTGPWQSPGINAVYDQVARRLRHIIDQHGPDAFAFYVSGQLSTESQYLANKLAKGFIGTNNIDSNSRLCMSSAASGYRLSLGADAPPGSYTDFEKCDCFFVIGANMADCHPILFLRLLDRKKASGAKLIVADPRRTATADKADLYLPIKPGTDLALLNGLLYLLMKAGQIDPAFINKNTHGWAELRLLLLDYTPERVAAWTNLREEDIRLAARWFGEAPEAMTLWTMGLNQSTHGTWHTNAICNLHLATGKICRPGSGPFSLTGQPNAMGGREVGYLSQGLPGQRLVTKEKDRTFIENLWHLPAGSIKAQPGLDAVTLFQKMTSGEVKAVWIIGTNPVASMPNRQSVIEGLQTAECVIVQDAFHPTETSRYADLLLPGALWAEAEGTMINSDRNVALMQAAIDPPGEAQPDWLIIAEIARRLGYSAAFPYATASEVFDEIRATHNPVSGYDLRGISYARLRESSCQWPCPPDAPQGEPIRYQTESGLRFATESGFAQFLARPYLPPAELPDADFPFILTTGRLPHQWHTLTKTGKVAQLNKLNSGPTLDLHPDDADALDLWPGDRVTLTSRRGQAVLPVLITPRQTPGTCFTTFHWNDEFGANLAINAITSEARDAISLQPELKFCAVKLQRLAVPGEFNRAQMESLRSLGEKLIATPLAQVPVTFPADAPFTEAQRTWLHQLLSDPPSISKPAHPASVDG